MVKGANEFGEEGFSPAAEFFTVDGSPLGLASTTPTTCGLLVAAAAAAAGGGGGEDSQGLVGISQNDRSIPIRDGSTGHHSLIICHPFTINLFELRLGCTQASL